MITLAAAVAVADVSDHELDVDFRSGQVDRSLFRPDVKDSKGRWRVTTEDGLVAVIPKGPEDRPPIKYTSQFDLEGDFEVVAEYLIVVLSRPHVSPGKKADNASNNVELVISGPGGWCTVNRRHTDSGEVGGYYAKVGERESPSGGLPEKGKAGRLGIRRAGDRLTFLRGGEAGPLEELGTIDYFREPVSEVSLQVNAWNSIDGIEVRFPRVRIKAGRIVRRDGRSGPSPFGPVLLGGLLAVAAALAIGTYQWSHRRAEARAGRSR